MAGFLYFIPSASPPSDPMINTSGLADMISALNCTHGACANGPGDRRGYIVTTGKGAPRCRYEPESQTWAKHDEYGVYVGIWNDDPPKPEDVARPVLLGNYAPELGDGNAWRVPTIMDENGDSDALLPCTRKIDPDSGKFVRRIDERFDALREAADRIREHFKLGNSEMDTDDEARICVAAIAVNYRMGAHEVSMLGLLSDAAQFCIFSILVDRQNWPDWKSAD